MARLSGPTPRMTLPRALRSEALRLRRSPLVAVHLVCGLAAGLACGEYFSVARWDPALGADAYAQFLGALMPLMSAIVCGLTVDEERSAGHLANLTVVPSRGRAVMAKWLVLMLAGASALAVALGSDRRHEAPRSVAECAFAARGAAVSALIEGGYDGYVIHTRPSAGDMERYRMAGARFVLLDPGEDECLARAESDRRPPRTFDAIRSWYENPPRIPTD